MKCRYVGKSEDVLRRMFQHTDKTFTHIGVVPVLADDQTCVEAACIGALQPELNRTSGIIGARLDELTPMVAAARKRAIRAGINSHRMLDATGVCVPKEIKPFKQHMWWFQVQRVPGIYFLCEKD